MYRVAVDETTRARRQGERYIIQQGIREKDILSPITELCGEIWAIKVLLAGADSVPQGRHWQE